MTTTLRGIELCETDHVHDITCRHACGICDGLYPPSLLIGGVCASCWREHYEQATVEGFRGQSRN
jgi:hypothetical protein